MTDRTIPVATVSRLRNITTAVFAQARAGVISLAEAEAAVADAIDRFEAHRKAMVAIRDAEVAASADGIVGRNSPETSRDAAAKVAVHAGTQRAALLERYVETGGRTDHQMARDLKMLPNSVRPRRNELIALGYVVASGKKRKHRGSDCNIWVPTDEARAWVARQEGETA